MAFPIVSHHCIAATATALHCTRFALLPRIDRHVVADSDHLGIAQAIAILLLLLVVVVVSLVAVVAAVSACLRRAP